MKRGIKYFFVMCLMGLSSVASFASTASYEVQASKIIYGKLSAFSKLNNQNNPNVKCGYFLTKSAAYKPWGPSLTFFIEDAASGKRKILYHMLNGTRQLDPIESLSVLSATEYNIDVQAGSYTTTYEKKIGAAFGALPKEINKLSLVRKSSFIDKTATYKDTKISQILFTKEVARGLLRDTYEPVTQLYCSFGSHILRF